MTTLNLNRTDDNLKKSIDALDLDPIKVKLMDEEDGLGWTAQQVDEAEKFYKRFLFLVGKYPDTPIVPTKQIDAFWHQHILDTRKYFSDCISIFGEYIHHFPYFGMRSDEDAKDLQNAASETYKLYVRYFGESVSKLTEIFVKQGENVETVCSACTPKPPSCNSSCSSCSNDVIPNSLLRPSLPSNAMNKSYAWY